MRHLVVALSLCAFASAPGRAEDADDEPVMRVTLAGKDGAGEPLVRVECVDAPLFEVLRALSRAARRTAVAAPWSGPVTLTLGPLPWRDAVAALAALDGSRVTPLGPRGLRTEPAPRMTIDFDAASVRTILQLSSSYSGLNLVIGDDVAGQLTMTVRGVDALDVLHALARACAVLRGAAPAPG